LQRWDRPCYKIAITLLKSPVARGSWLAAIGAAGSLALSLVSAPPPSPADVRPWWPAAALAWSLSGSAAWGATPPPFHAPRAAVASDHPLASAAGVAALKAGGNAVDAACATALALGVLHPDSSGIGGGGFAVVYLAKENKVFTLDFRERAPAAIAPGLYLKDGHVQPALSKEGGLAVAVPGEVRGLGEMVRRWGKLPFGRCVDPAQRLATRGFPVSWRLAGSLAGLAKRREGAPAPATPADHRFAEVFSASPLVENATWRRPDLAWTLGKLRAAGADSFYKGEIASEIVHAVAAAGGVLTAEDLSGYAPADRAPLVTDYRGLRVYSMPPPSSGGVVLVETLGILAARYPDLAALVGEGRGSSAYLHLLAEAFKHGFADRARFLGDTDFVSVDMAHLTSPAYHAELARRIKPGAVLAREGYGTPGGPAADHHDGGTTHLSVIDADGNAVALTTTVNLGFGAKLLAGKTGILLNDQMDDFALAPGTPNAFGLIGNEQNAVAPGKRPLSSMTPTIALDGDRVRVVLGAAGGPTIITATAQVFLNVVDWKLDAQAAVAAPRIHDQWFPEIVGVEPEIPADVIEGLVRRGHHPKEFAHIGTVNVLVRTDAGIQAGAEPRSPSAPAGY
jgi:gamma-glutamyltranspeptidase / glutathione hydrolase